MRKESTTEYVRRRGEVVTAPGEVFAVAQLFGDLEVLMDFTSRKVPPQIPVRLTRAVSIYMVGDASGTGFGGSTWEAGAVAIGATFGGWDNRVNFREALNLVLMVEAQTKSGELIPGTEVFVFTDNSTAECAFNKGSSSSKKLHELVVRLRKMEMTGHITPRFMWISGERMIAQGTDGLSRGDLTCGVMNDGKFLQHIPLNKTVFEYVRTLSQEAELWYPRAEGWEYLSEEGWFDQAFRNPRGKYVWSPLAALRSSSLKLNTFIPSLAMFSWLRR